MAKKEKKCIDLSDPETLTEVGHLPRELAKLLTSVPKTSMYCVVAQDTPVYTKGLDIPINLTITVLPLDKSLVRKL